MKIFAIFALSNGDHLKKFRREAIIIYDDW